MSENMSDYIKDMLGSAAPAAAVAPPVTEQAASDAAAKLAMPEKNVLPAPKSIAATRPALMPSMPIPPVHKSQRNELTQAAMALQMKMQQAQQSATPIGELHSPADRYVTFELAEQCYGLPIVQVKEVLPMPDITPVPGAPSHCPGVINLRGDIVTVLDLRRILGLPSQKSDSLVVLNDGMALCVDAIGSIIDAEAENCAPPPNVGASQPFVGGITRHRGRFILLVDIEVLEKTLSASFSGLNTRH